MLFLGMLWPGFIGQMADGFMLTAQEKYPLSSAGIVERSLAALPKESQCPWMFFATSFLVASAAKDSGQHYARCAAMSL